MSEGVNTGMQPNAFDCTMCGHCCEGKGGIVVSHKDLERLCAFMGIGPEEFEYTWGERRGHKLHIRTGVNGACIFFEKNTGCGIHAAKPDICRAWPFFRGNLVDSQSLALSKDFCPGISRGCSHEDFTLQGLECLEREEIIGRGGADEASALQVRDLLENMAKLSGK